MICFFPAFDLRNVKPIEYTLVIIQIIKVYIVATRKVIQNIFQNKAISSGIFSNIKNVEYFKVLEVSVPSFSLYIYDFLLSPLVFLIMDRNYVLRSREVCINVVFHFI